MSLSEEKIKKSKRRFSKRLVVANIIAAWLVLALSVPFGQAQVVITHVFAFVTVLIGIYTGVGHMDFRKVLEAAQSAPERVRERDVS